MADNSLHPTASAQLAGGNARCASSPARSCAEMMLHPEPRTPGSSRILWVSECDSNGVESLLPLLLPLHSRVSLESWVRETVRWILGDSYVVTLALSPTRRRLPRCGKASSFARACCFFSCAR